ncbi:MAG: DNA photolyase [Silicimonas sp.]|nr:DNA photolyase [Silicimonas sp.]
MTQTDALLGLETPSETVTFAPTRAAGLARLDQFISRAGKHYTSQRNYDFGPERRSNVSALSPWIRHRLITEEEVLKETLARHAPSTAEKFIQEVFWRTYFKGWLEQRPSVWTGYLEGLDKALMSLQKDRAMAVDYEDAIEGRSGIDGFDQWARELVETGYMHNHARMWFASIWVFTLKLPWELGADFFLRHLLDGDPASNTLGWRWIAGLHTKGKAYQARVSNISKYTEGRFRPEYQLANSVIPLSETGEHARRPIPAADAEPDQDYLLLITEEDCRPETLFKSKPASVMGLIATQERSPLDVSPLVETFAQSAVQDAVKRMSATEDTSITSDNWAQKIIGKAEGENLKNVVTAYAPVGPVATQVAAVKPALEDAGITLHEVRRDYDDLAWPHATKGFFALKQKIPNVLEQLGLR